MGMLNVLVVDDSRTLRMGLAKMLQQMGHTVTMAENGEEGIEAFVAQRPGLILMDVSMPVLDGYETARRIRATFSDDWVPIIFLSGSEDDQDLERAIAAGGDDYLVKPVSYVVLSAKIQAMCRIEQMRQRLLALTRQLATANSELERLSRQDALTGLANRRFFDFSLAAELARARRAQHPLALLMCDVDHFKAYNDTYGHLAGDECLQRIARVLKESCRRTSDLAARYGGEEFSLVLPATPLDGAAILGEALRCAVRDLRIPHERSATAPHITLSVGIAEYVPPHETTAESLIFRADQALYQAKQLGRDRVIVAGASLLANAASFAASEIGSRPRPVPGD